jgi:(1->4)-alpha-D-glucan 1-alpha-D-glucosylmutase
VLDIVPNHMATDDANRYWSDPALREQFFDIDAETGRHRRFFDIDHLAGVRQEDPEVFEETHRLALSLVREGAVDGLRIDHPTGSPTRPATSSGCARAASSTCGIEKILDPGEKLRPWPVDGTVGYEFLNDAAALFVDPEGEAPLTALWAEVSGDARPFGEVADAAKREQASTVVHARGRAPAPDPRPRRPRRGAVLAAGLPHLPARRAGRAEDAEVLREAGIEWLPDAPGEFVTRFQQTTPPVMAKGVEDTAFYRYGRLLALNDVGGDPSRFGISVETFHAGNAERAERFPAQPARHADARHQALGRRAGPHRRTGRDGRGVGGPPAHVALAAQGRAGAGRRRAVLHLSDAGGRVADRARTARGLHGEGAARGEGQHELDRAR